MPCALFLATKTDNYYMSLRAFTERIPNSSTEDIVAPEFLLSQGLRFTFDVRHPFRGLEGGIMELLAIAQGDGRPGPHHPDQTAAGLQNVLQGIAPAPASAKADTNITTRISRAHHNAREILKSAAQMTDAYFLYTPSQIWLSALLLADKPLAEFYLDVKLGPNPGSAATSNGYATNPLTPLRLKIQITLTPSSALLASYSPPSAPEADPDTAAAKLKSLKRIAKKLYHCQNPEKLDLVGLNRAHKRDSTGTGTGTATAAGTPAGADSGSGNVDGGGGGSEVERAAKKRKLERERKEREGREAFGGELVAARRAGGVRS
jgi:cyclin H